MNICYNWYCCYDNCNICPPEDAPNRNFSHITQIPRPAAERCIGIQLKHLWDSSDFFSLLSGSALFPCPFPFPSRRTRREFGRTGAFHGRKVSPGQDRATGNLLKWEWGKVRKRKGRELPVFPDLSLCCLPCSPPCADNAHHHPIITNPGGSLPSAFSSSSHLPSCFFSAEIWVPQTVQEFRSHWVISCLCYVSPQQEWVEGKPQGPLLFLAQHDNFESRFICSLR